MKLRYLIFILPLAIASCNNNGNKSDAYGNFEATEVIISAQGSGKLISFNIDEGKQLKEGEIVGVIDTVDLSLKRQQLITQKESMLSRLTNVNSQVEVQRQQKKNLNVDNDRIAKMYKDGAATKKQVDDITGAIEVIDKQISATETQSATIEKDIKGIEKQVEQINESINKCYIKNENNGTVLVKYTEPGEITTFGKSLYKIANLQDMILKVYVSGDQLPKVK
ncbi:MAG: HlyD family secretion protein, partial [Bacteroidota bacterium]